MNRDILERPFEAALIKTRRGAFGKTLSYVEGADGGPSRSWNITSTATRSL
jgi:hypothetical protein